jgi:ABC-2 type transport system ATP-binding protein
MTAVQALIDARGLSKRHGKTLAVDRVDWQVLPGQIVGLLGPNGAGKSSLLNAVLGLTPFEGRLRVLGLDPWTQRDQLMQQVSFVSDVAVLPRYLRVNQLLAYMQGVHPRFSLAKAHAMLERSGIEAKAPIKSLSKGMLAQLHLAAVMAIDARLLVLDEPTLGLDAVVRQRFYDRLLGECATPDRAIVVAGHQLEELSPVLSHVLMLRKGRVLLQGAVDGLFEQFVVLHVPPNPQVLAQARALKPMRERPSLGQVQFVFDLRGQTPPDQPENTSRLDGLAELGELRQPSMEDLFVALMSAPDPAVSASSATTTYATDPAVLAQAPRQQEPA